MLTIYAPFNNRNSKAWEVFNGVEKSWPDQVTKLNNAVETDPVSNLFGITPNQTPTNLPNFGGAPTNVVESSPTPESNFFGNVQAASVQPSAGVRTNPSFLGSNPEDILKNLDIARRTG